MTRRAFGVVALVVATALSVAGCASSGSDTATTVVSEPVASPTPIATTAPALLPPATPTPVVVPAPTATPAPVASPTAPAPTATAVPTAEAFEPTSVPSGQPATPAATAVPVLPPSNDSPEVMVANGAEVYTIACARCHAENGTGSERYSGLIGVGSRYSSAAMITELTTGHPVTFGFAGQLSADEIASVVAYVKAAFP